jgi:hypothetical protein
MSVPANRVEAALSFLEAKRQKRGSHVVIELILAAAKCNGWHWNPYESESTPDNRSISGP